MASSIGRLLGGAVGVPSINLRVSSIVENRAGGSDEAPEPLDVVVRGGAHEDAMQTGRSSGAKQGKGPIADPLRDAQ